MIGHDRFGRRGRVVDHIDAALIHGPGVGNTLVWRRILTPKLRPPFRFQCRLPGSRVRRADNSPHDTIRVFDDK